MKKKILLTGIGENMGGIESFATTILDNFSEKYDFSILAATTHTIAKEDYFEQKCKKIFYLPQIFGLRNVIKRPKIIRSFFKHNKFDIVHINATTLNAFYIAQEANRQGSKVVYHIHNFSPSGYRFLPRLLTKILTPYSRFKLKHMLNVELVAVSDESENKLFGTQSNAKVIFNGINTEQFLYKNDIQRKMRKKFNILPNEKVGIVVARLMPIKNYSKTLQIIKEGLQSEFDKFFIVGNGPEKSSIINIIDSFPKQIRNKIYFLGERMDIARLLIMSDFFILTSFTEGLSISVIEAQAAGLGVIASDGIPVSTNITNKVHFLSVHASNEEWLMAIKNTLDDKNNRCEMNRLVAASDFSDINFCKSIEKLYR